MSNSANNNNENKLQFQLMDVGNKLFNVSSLTPDILSVLMEMEKVLSRVKRPPSNMMIIVLHPIIQALIAEKLVRHPDVNVNTAVVCCICQIIRIMAPNAPYNHEEMKEIEKVLLHPIIQALIAEILVRHLEVNVNISLVSCICVIIRMMVPNAPYNHEHMKDFFEVLFTSFEKQFLTSAASNSSATLLEMEKIMSMIIEESKELALDLEALIIATLEKIDSPVCWQLGEKVLLNCACKRSNISIPDMEAKETIPSTSETSNMRNDTTHNIKVDCLEKSIDTVQTLRHCENATTDKVNLPGHHTEERKKKVSSDDPQMPSESVTEVKGNRTRKRKRNNRQVLPFASGNYSSMAVGCGSVLRVLPKSAHSWTREDAKKKVSSDDPPMPSKSVTEVTGKNEQQGVPRKVSYSMTHVRGYKVKKIHAPILEAIFKKHGDIASDCVVKTASVRESILEVVCGVVKRIQTNDVATIVSDLEEIEMQVLDAEATNMKVAWLRAHLETIQKRTAAQKKSSLIVKMKVNTTLVKRAAKMDLEERRIELLTAQEHFEKAEKCVKVLDLVEMKLNDDFVDSKAQKDLWPEQPIL